MAFKLIIMALAIVSTAARLPVRQQQSKRLCPSIVDCEACLLVPDCYASFRPIFKCQQYPIVSGPDDNITVIVEDDKCCPTSSLFSHEHCGFAPKTAHASWTLEMSMIAAAIGTLLVVTIGIILCVWARKRHTGEMRVGIPSASRMPRLEPNAPLNICDIRPSQGTVRPNQRNASARENRSLSSVLQQDIHWAAVTDWEARRASLRNHPLDQTTV